MQLNTNKAGTLDVNEEPKPSSGAVSWMMGLAALLTFEALFLIFIIYGVATVDTDGSITLLSILGLVFLSPPALFFLLAVQAARGNRAAPRLATECYLVLLLLGVALGEEWVSGFVGVLHLVHLTMLLLAVKSNSRQGYETSCNHARSV